MIFTVTAKKRAQKELRLDAEKEELTSDNGN